MQCSFISTYTCPSNKVNFNWTKATDKDLIDYKYLTRMYCKNIHAADIVKCNDVNCKSHDHLNQIDTLYSQLCSVLKQASDDSIPTSKIHTHHDYILYQVLMNLLNNRTMRHAGIIYYGRRLVSPALDYCI